MPANTLPPIRFDENGLAPAIVQDAATGQVLMLAYMNAEALQHTIETRQAWFWSRSRQELWHKGATSGNVQEVVEMRYDCDGDALLLQVHPAGPACHTGEVSCFYREVQLPVTGDQLPVSSEQSPVKSDQLPVNSEQGPVDSKQLPVNSEPRSESGGEFSLRRLYEVICSRRDAPQSASYTARLFGEGLPKIAQKVGEEAVETLVAALAQDEQRLVEEAADLAYHALVLLAARRITPARVLEELARRHHRPPAASSGSPASPSVG